MSEIIKIILIFPLFLIFIFAPLSVFNKNNKEINLSYLNYNLIINCNILLILSFFPIPIKDYQIILIALYFLIFLYSFIFFKKNFNNLKKNNYLGFLILFFSFIILSLVISNKLDLGWDAKYFYYIKSLFFFEGLGLEDLSKFEYNKWHPYFGSYIWAFFWSIPFIDLEYFGRLFYLFIFCFSIYFITIKNNKNFFFNNILYLLFLIIFFKYERFSGLQEILIFSFLVISSKILYELTIKKNLLDIFILLLISNLVFWIKSEGIVYAIIIVTILISNKKIFFKEKIYIFLSIIFLFLLKNLIFTYYNFEVNAQPYNLEHMLSIKFDDFFYRVKNIIIYLGYYSLKNTLFALAIILLIILNFTKKNKIVLTNYNLFFALNILFIFSAYLFRDLEILYSLRTTMERIVFTSSGFYIYLIILFINNQIKINKKNGKLYK